MKALRNPFEAMLSSKISITFIFTNFFLRKIEYFIQSLSPNGQFNRTKQTYDNSNGESNAFSSGCFVSFSLRIA